MVISCSSEIIVKHPRSYERDDFIYDPIHYLPPLEKETGALDQAAPLQNWELPEEFGTLRRLLESRMGRRGKREFVHVLRLLETFSLQEVPPALKYAFRLGALSFDAVKHLVLYRLEGRPPGLDLELYPYLPSEGQHHVYTRLYDSPRRVGGMNDRSALLLEHHRKELKTAQLPQGAQEDGLPERRRGSGPTQGNCSGWRNWNSSIATSAWWSGGFGRPDSLPSRALYLERKLLNPTNPNFASEERRLSGGRREFVVGYPLAQWLNSARKSDAGLYAPQHTGVGPTLPCCKKNPEQLGRILSISEVIDPGIYTVIDPP